MPKKSKTLCVDDLRHAEYYGMLVKINSLREQANLSAII